MKKDVLDKNTVRVIKISKDALFEYIYENLIDDQEDFLNVNCLDVTNAFDMDFDNNEFIFCAYKSENEKGQIIELPNEIDLTRIMHNIKDTTSTLFDENRYKDYTKEELIEISKKSESNFL